MRGAGSSSHVVPLEGDGIPMVRLDDYAAEAGLARVDFVKMDVEGFEPAVLAGAVGLIGRFGPPILMEFNTWCLAYVQGFEARTFARHLWDAFTVASLNEDGAGTPAGGGDLGRFLHDNVVLHGTVEDVLLRPRPGGRLHGLRGRKPRRTSSGSAPWSWPCKPPPRGGSPRRYVPWAACSGASADGSWESEGRPCLAGRHAARPQPP